MRSPDAVRNCERRLVLGGGGGGGHDSLMCMSFGSRNFTIS